MQINKKLPVPGDHLDLLAAMEDGDSIFFEGVSYGGTGHQAASQYFRRRDIKTTSRTEEGGVRLWRVGLDVKA